MRRHLRSCLRFGTGDGLLVCAPLKHSSIRCTSHRLVEREHTLKSLSDMKLLQYHHRNVTLDSAATSSDIDLERARCFLADGSVMDARQALMESLRWKPFSHETRRLLQSVDASLAPMLQLPAEIVAAEPMFAMMYDALKHHTMLTWPRLFSLFVHARMLTEKSSPEGDILECGCAGGGSVVLFAAAFKYFREIQPQSERCAERRVFALDTFSGMPPPSNEDHLLNGSSTSSRSADDTHWSTGTCSGSEAHVHALARAFGVTHRGGVDANNKLPLRRCAFLHCDADWYESTVCVLRHVLPIMPSGSTVQLDDYNYWGGCKKAVDEVLHERSISRNNLQDVDGNAALLVLP
ncbi:Hypothetical protein, putative [Bodo saltans]|uniref:Methyltransferase n=1 Tax=Bodo saltans TaxID=75058 RepID=A0A0S4JTC1_BODSA|nr:Hypothetical protein, putative [Bodo saltans]|eukprot:CUG93838.1 Hypothetical protein, putative [Bodo saltans]